MTNKSSSAEDVVANWLSKAGIAFVRSNWQLIKSPSGHKMEIDIYIPSLKIGIECDGVAYHKEDPNLPYWKWQLITRGGKLPCYAKWSGYHKWKDDRCAEKGIKLIHICSEDVHDLPDKTRLYLMEEINQWTTLLESKD